MVSLCENRGSMSPLERDALAKRIADVLLERKKFGAERRIQARDFQTYYGERAYVRRYALEAEPVAQQVGAVTDPPGSSAKSVGDRHSGKIATLFLDEEKPQRSPLSFRWNSPNG